MVTEEKLDVVEVSDEIIRQDRYGMRNYRNSIGEDNRRHWHGDFVADEEDVEGEEQVVDADTFDEALQGSTLDDTEPTETDAEDLSEEEDVEDTSDEEAADTADEEGDEDDAQATDTSNIVDVDYTDFDDDEPKNTDAEMENFFDPLRDVEGLDEVVSSGEDVEDNAVNIVNDDQTEEQEQTDEDTVDLTEDKPEEQVDDDERTDPVS